METQFNLGKENRIYWAMLIEEFRDLRHDYIQLSDDVIRNHLLVLFPLSWLRSQAGSLHEVAESSSFSLTSPKPNILSGEKVPVPQ